MSNKLLPYLEDEEDAAPFLVNMEAFCLVEGYYSAIDLAAYNNLRPAEPPANATPAQRAVQLSALQEWRELDNKFYGYLVLALSKVPMLRDRLLSSQAVTANPRRGSILMKAFRDELYANPNASIYNNRLTKIRAYRQNDTKLPKAIAEINKLYSGLSADFARTDHDKIIQLRTSLQSKYADMVKTLTMSNPMMPYTTVCDHLIRESLAEDLISLSSVGEKEEAHTVAEHAADAFIAEDRGRSRSPHDDRHSSDYSQSRGRERDHRAYGGRSYTYDRHRSPRRSPENYRPRASYSPRDSRRYNSSSSTSYSRRSYSRSPGRGRSYSRSPSADRSMKKARSPSPHPRGALKHSVHWNDQQTIRCFKCNKVGHKSYECRQK